MPAIARYARRFATLIALLLFCIILIVLVILPIGALIFRAQWQFDGILMPLSMSTLTSGISALVAFIFGSVTATQAFTLPLPLRRILDVLCLVSITIPQFVIAAALKATLGRTNIGRWFPLVPDFAGTGALIIAFIIALFPLSYVSARFILSSIDPAIIDTAYVSGIHGWRLYKNVFLGRLSAIAPAVCTVMFITAISDPITPNILAPKTANVANQIWLTSSTLEHQSFSYTLALMLLAPSLLAALSTLILAIQQSRKNGHRYLFRNATPSYTLAWSLPVGVSLWPKVLITLFSACCILLPLYTIVFQISQTAAPLRPQSPQVIINTVSISLIALLSSSTITFAALWLRRTQGIWIDALLAFLLFIPSATLGQGYKLLYTASQDSSLWSIISFSHTSTAFMVLASMPSAIPLTYFAALYIGPVTSRAELQAAMLLGLAPLRALRMIAIPRLSAWVVTAFLVVLSTSSVMVAPLMWVTSAETPVVVPHLFALLDAARYPIAFTLSLHISILILTIAAMGMLCILPLRLRLIRNVRAHYA